MKNEISAKGGPASGGKTKLQRYYMQFLEYLEIERNRSKMTLRNYDHYLKRFVDFAAKQGVTNPEDIDLELVRSYRLFINRMTQKDNGRNLKVITKLPLDCPAKFPEIPGQA